MEKLIYFGYYCGEYKVATQEEVKNFIEKKKEENDYDGDCEDCMGIIELKVNIIPEFNEFRLETHRNYDEIIIYKEFRANTDADTVSNVINAVKCCDDYDCDMVTDVLEFAGVKVEKSKVIPLEF